jgi:hypothetical protein
MFCGFTISYFFENMMQILDVLCDYYIYLNGHNNVILDKIDIPYLSIFVEINKKLIIVSFRLLYTITLTPFS